MNWRNRSLFYVLLLMALGSHLLTIGASAAGWAALTLNYVAYPHLAYWRARRARDQRLAEMHNMDADIVMAGAWIASLGAPLWISFILCASGCINMVVFHGARGGLRLMLSLAVGMALAALVVPLAWQPETDLRTSVLCMIALLLYLFAFARDGYDRAMSQSQANSRLRKQYDEIQSLQAQLREQALRDPLTGLFNRRQLDATLGPAMQLCREQGACLSVLIVDIDHFKRINDTHGHAAGDAVLQSFAQLLLRHMRPQDMAYRIGGEEFLLVLGGTPLDTAVERAHMLREAVEVLRVRTGSGELSVTLSCGAAAFPLHAQEPQDLLDCADQALYEAKKGGRNRVVTHPGPVPLQPALSASE
ncbi:diguanylate cyclase [Oryzisolibacter sp. LB2S]|uniref:sensor domain-containing diguanylate cyclase n=1 Tax=Alicycliphilus soli TaxID=3228789 RepID=UPI0034584E8C